MTAAERRRLLVSTSISCFRRRQFTIWFTYLALCAPMLPIFAAGQAPETSPAAQWYSGSGGWTNRKRITIDHTKVAGSLSEFPVLFAITDDDLRSIKHGGKVRSESGLDITFTAADGVTKLAHEMEAYDAGTGVVTAWIRVPELSPVEDTVLYIYFGTAAVNDQSNSHAVWENGYSAVYHLSDRPGPMLATPQKTALR